MSETIEKFWIVTRDLHVLSATHRHPDEVAAIADAEFLCRKEGAPFFVFALVGAVKPAAPPVEWVPAEDPKAPVGMQWENGDSANTDPPIHIPSFTVPSRVVARASDDDPF